MYGKQKRVMSDFIPHRPSFPSCPPRFVSDSDSRWKLLSRSPQASCLLRHKVPRSAQSKCRKRIVLDGSTDSLRSSHPVVSMTSARKRKRKIKRTF